MSLNLLFIKLAGGPGSGNWGHQGRPGKVGGSSKSIQSVASAGVQAVLDYGLRTGNEALVAYDKDGNQINGLVEGTENEVSNSGKVLTKDTFLSVHNHPGSSSFSSNDIRTFLTEPHAHMIVAGHDGTLYRLTKPENYQLSPEYQSNPDRILNYHKGRVNKFMYQFQGRVLRGELGEDEAWREHSHLATVETTKKFGITYERVEP